MTDGQNKNRLGLEPNSKPYLFKRIISDGFDTAAVFLLFLLFSAIVFASPLANAYNGHIEKCREIRESAAEQFGDDAEAIAKALGADGTYGNERFAADLHGYLLKLLAGFAAEAAVLLIVPMISKNRCTPGKLMTGIMPFSAKKQTRATRLAILGRFAFVFLIDSAFPYLYTGIYTFLAVPVIRLIEMLLNKKNKTVCDAVSSVMIIEKTSYDGID